VSIHSGKFGAVNGISTVRNWVVNEVETPARFRASNTGAGTGRRTGVYDCTGSFEGYGTPDVMPGEYFNFKGFTASTSGAYGAAGARKDLDNAIVQQVTVNWNWKTGDIINWMVTFAAGEPLELVHATGAVTDLTTTEAPKPCGTLIEVNDQPWVNLVSAVLTITADNPSFVNSGTSCNTGRRPGPIDWTLAVVEEARTPSHPRGANYDLKLYIDAFNFWHINWGRMVSNTDLRVDMDSGAIISMTTNFEMNSNHSTTGVLGFLRMPGEDGASGGDAYWPTRYKAAILPF
jgi:hypothetical protein